MLHNEVSAAQNIDFSLVEGAAVCRRGSQLYADTGISSRIKNLYINHNTPYNLGSDPMYVAVGSSVLRGVSGAFTALDTSYDMPIVPFSFYNNQTLFANGLGTSYLMDDGTNVTQWVKEAPSAAVTATATSTTVTLSGTWTAIEGTLTASSTSSATATESAGLGQITLNFVPSSTNLSTLGTYTIGDWGVQYVTLQFSDPASVNKVSVDYSIGGTGFSNYYHSELYGDGTATSVADPATMVDSSVVNSTDTNTPVTIDTKDSMFSTIRVGNTGPTAQISSVPNAPNVIGFPRPDVYLIGKYASTGWGKYRCD